MDIKLLPSRERVLVDANIFIYHLGGSSQEVKNFMVRVARRDLEAYLTTVIVAEVLHRRMIAEAVDKGLVTPGQALKKLKAEPLLIRQLSDYVTDVDVLFDASFHHHRGDRTGHKPESLSASNSWTIRE